MHVRMTAMRRQIFIWHLAAEWQGAYHEAKNHSTFYPGEMHVYSYD
jgi:hypothetical protein